MSQILADRRDVDFVLYEQLRIEEFVKYEKFSWLKRKFMDSIISEARKLSINEILPTNSEGDRAGVRFEKGSVYVPECYHRPYRLFLDGEWTSINEDQELGGQGLPTVINTACFEYIWGANYCLANYGTMGHGTGKMVELFGTDEQKALFLRKLYKAEWTGTMLLTESQAGSDVGALTTKAVRNQDGTYSITGSKIFITNGDHDLSENIIHPVLARIDGAPEGTGGISIFLVPKIWVNPDGTLGEPNDIICTGIEEKLGIHGSATCSMSMGEKGKCRGLLLGKENMGMSIMFHMMNEARFNVGFQAFTYASSAYLYAANYAKERIQGKDMAAGKDSNSSGVAIINHPDIRRMLMWMKSHVDGMRSFLYYVSILFDHISPENDSQTNERLKNLIDFCIPLVKAYCSQRSFKVCSEAMQVYGGYGYIREYPVEQLLRDSRITSIYEGTDGIQAMDLMGRKLNMKGGQLFTCFTNEVRKTISDCSDITQLPKFCAILEKSLSVLEETAAFLKNRSVPDTMKNAFLYAFPFLESTGDIIMAWMLLWRASVALRKNNKDLGKKDKDYYMGQVMTAEFFFHNCLPEAVARLEAILNFDDSALRIPDACFGG
ncbi:acyl-CoA dehydrogenase [Desulforegula conservatrix]|uniref:acyl-CoA dehydrogenase n=1 Tax=Desulforegula conservatrix TaxID=153026 RepID=UPI00042839C6|nr:acyl-CoA dehydrogenase [Desulforegula conservatrix]